MSGGIWAPMGPSQTPCQALLQHSWQKSTSCSRMNTCSLGWQAVKYFGHNLQRCRLSRLSGAHLSSLAHTSAGAALFLSLYMTPSRHLLVDGQALNKYRECVCTRAGSSAGQLQGANSRRAFSFAPSGRCQQRVCAVVAAPPQPEAMVKAEPQAIYRKVSAEDGSLLCLCLKLLCNVAVNDYCSCVRRNANIDRTQASLFAERRTTSRRHTLLSACT